MKATVEFLGWGGLHIHFRVQPNYSAVLMLCCVCVVLSLGLWQLIFLWLSHKRLYITSSVRSQMSNDDTLMTDDRTQTMMCWRGTNLGQRLYTDGIIIIKRGFIFMKSNCRCKGPYLGKGSNKKWNFPLRGGAHWALMWYLTRKSLYQYLMPDYARRCQTSTLILVAINFWRNSDQIKKKTLTELENNRECLNIGAVPTYKRHNIGTVPTSKIK